MKSCRGRRPSPDSPMRRNGASPDMRDTIVLDVNGTRVEVAAGSTVAAALVIAGVTAFHHSPSGEARAPLCGMGLCFECRVTIDGRPHARSCQVLARDG